MWVGLWDTTGLNGGPGNALQLARTNPIALGPGNWTFLVYSDWPVPSGHFWQGWALGNAGDTSVTAADLNQIVFVGSNGPTVGSTSRPAVQSTTYAGWVSNPAVNAAPQTFLTQSVVILTPEPGSSMLIGLGLVAVGVALSRRRA